MDNKVMVDIYFTHGKGDGEEIGNRWVADDTRETREEALENTGYDDLMDDKEAFLEGRIDGMTFDRHGGDWDEPTGGFIRISNKNKLISSIKKRAEREVNEVENMFK